MVRKNLDGIELAAIAIGAAIGGVLKGALSDDMLRRFAELGNSLEAHNLMDSFPSDFEIRSPQPPTTQDGTQKGKWYCLDE